VPVAQSTIAERKEGRKGPGVDVTTHKGKGKNDGLFFFDRGVR